MTKLFVLGNIGSKFDNLLVAIADPENSGISYIAGEHRLNISDGYAFVALSILYDLGPDDQFMSKIFANTQRYYKRCDQRKIYMLWSNKGSQQERIAIETNNHFIKGCILANTPHASGVRYTPFAEHLIELMLVGDFYGVKLRFSDFGVRMLAVVKQELKFKEHILNNIHHLVRLKSRTTSQVTELNRCLGMLRTQIQRIVDTDNGTGRRIRTMVWKLCKADMLVEGSGLEPGSLDHKNNYNNLLLLYLKWMLGSEVFEYRRQEIQSRLYREVDDREVMDEIILDATEPDGAYRNHITSSISVLRVVDTLFLHSSIDDLSLTVSGRNYCNEPIDDWINAINLKAKSDLKITFSGDLEASKRLARDNFGSTAVPLEIDGVHVKVISFLHKNGITRVVSGHEKNPRTLFGSQFVQDGITFASLAYCHSELNKKPRCHALITCSEDLSETNMQIRANLHINGPDSNPEAIRISEISEPIDIGPNAIGFDQGSYLCVTTQSRVLIFTKFDPPKHTAAPDLSTVFVVPEGAIDVQGLRNRM